MPRSMSAPEPFGTRASNISERSVDANLLAEERLLYDFASNPAGPLATVSPCPYQENIRWRWAALACWLKHAQQRANFEFATDFFADKGWDCGQFRLNPQARARVPGLSMRPRMRGTPYHVGLFVVKLEWGLRCGVGSFFQ